MYNFKNKPIKKQFYKLTFLISTMHSFLLLKLLAKNIKHLYKYFQHVYIILSQLLYIDILLFICFYLN